MSERQNRTEVGDSGEPVRPVYLTVSAQSEGAGIDLLELWRTMWQGRWLVVAVTTLFALGSVAYALHATPIFRAEVVMTPASQPQQGSGLGGLGGLASLAGINFNASGDARHPLAILRSRKFIADFITDENLLPVLFANEWDSENKRWLDSTAENDRDVRDGVKLFIEDVRSVSEDSQTGLVTLSIEWTDAITATRWANELVDRVNSQVRSRDISDSQRKLDYLNDQLGKSSLVELRQAISRVIEEQINAMMLAQAQTEYAFKVIDPATVPKKRIRPKRTIIVIVATILGGVVAVFILIANLAIDRLRRSANLERVA